MTKFWLTARPSPFVMGTIESVIFPARSALRTTLDDSGSGFFAYVDAVGDADEIGIFEFDSGTLVPVIKQHV